MIPNFNEILIKKDSPKRQEPGKLFRSAQNSHYHLSPTRKIGVSSLIKPLTLYHRRHITSILTSPNKGSSSLNPNLNYGFSSFKGYNPTKPLKENQDTVFIQPYTDKDTSFFGVCDGHGLYGKEISSFIGQNLPIYLQKGPVSIKLFTDSIASIETDLKSCKFDVSYSGSTLTMCCIYKNRLFSINIGDSRAILGKRGYIKWDSIQLTRDHKPEIPEETARIVNSGGRVAAINNIGPYRVWMLNKNSPGLAMSRSLGDAAVHLIGVSSEPEINERFIGEDDEFLVIGSDGLFEFLTNQEIVAIAGEYYGNPKVACEELCNMARSRWIRVITM